MERHEAWIDRAKSSLAIAGTRNSNLVYYEDLCYQAQQAIEKAVKGLLIYYNVEPQFTHNIGVLLEELRACSNCRFLRSNRPQKSRFSGSFGACKVEF